MTPDPPSEPCWSVFLSFLTCGILPATTARRTNHLSLSQAFVLHLVAAWLGVLIVVFLVVWDDPGSSATLASVSNRLLLNAPAVIDALLGYPKESVLIVLGISSLVEVGFVALAYVMMPWGACDEPLGGSFRHALRRVWLQTPHVVLIVLLVGACVVCLQRTERAWNSARPLDTRPVPTLPEGTKPGTPAWDEYNARMREYWTEVGRLHRQRREQQPWYLRFGEGIAVDLGFLTSLWLLWALLRSVGAPRVVSAVQRPPRCDACGYNLTTIPMESRCPECGEPVAASLGPDARPGTAWQHRELDRLTAWRRSWGEAIRDPVRFGRTLRLTTPGVDHRRFLALHLPLVFLIGVASPAMTFWAVEGRSPIPDEIEFILIGGPIFGTACTVGVMAVSLLSAAAAAILYHFRDRRNLLAGAVQVVSYLVVYLVAWQVFGAVTGICAVSMGQADWFRGFARASPMGPELLAFFLWFIPNLACGIGYWTLVRRAVSGTRFANR